MPTTYPRGLVGVALRYFWGAHASPRAISGVSPENSVRRDAYAPQSSVVNLTPLRARPRVFQLNDAIP
jgi:hypothetical protein